MYRVCYLAVRCAGFAVLAVLAGVLDLVTVFVTVFVLLITGLVVLAVVLGVTVVFLVTLAGVLALLVTAQAALVTVLGVLTAALGGGNRDRGSRDGGGNSEDFPREHEILRIGVNLALATCRESTGGGSLKQDISVGMF